MQVGRYQFTLLPAEDDPPVDSGEFQGYFQVFQDGLTDGGLTVVPGPQDTRGSMAEVIVPMTQAVVPVISAAVGVYVAYRANRKVRIKAGGVEIDASTAEEAEQLFDHAVIKFLDMEEKKKA